MYRILVCPCMELHLSKRGWRAGWKDPGDHGRSADRGRDKIPKVTHQPHPTRVRTNSFQCVRYSTRSARKGKRHVCGCGTLNFPERRVKRTTAAHVTLTFASTASRSSDVSSL